MLAGHGLEYGRSDMVPLLPIVGSDCAGAPAANCTTPGARRNSLTSCAFNVMPLILLQRFRPRAQCAAFSVFTALSLVLSAVCDQSQWIGHTANQ